MPEAVAYKILTADELGQLEHEGRFVGAAIDRADGYIHLSTADQLAGTLAKHFGDRQDLALAAVDVTALGDQLRWEPARGGDLFPHLYGSLPLDAVLAYGPVEYAADGSLKLPVAG